MVLLANSSPSSHFQGQGCFLESPRVGSQPLWVSAQRGPDCKCHRAGWHDFSVWSCLMMECQMLDLQHSSCALIYCYFSQQLWLHSYFCPLRLQPGRNSVHPGAGPLAATKGTFTQISIVLFINETQDSRLAWKAVNSETKCLCWCLQKTCASTLPNLKMPHHSKSLPLPLPVALYPSWMPCVVFMNTFSQTVANTAYWPKVNFI